MQIMVKNRGPEIVETNYWRSEHAASGLAACRVSTWRA